MQNAALYYGYDFVRLQKNYNNAMRTHDLMICSLTTIMYVKIALPVLCRKNKSYWMNRIQMKLNICHGLHDLKQNLHCWQTKGSNIFEEIKNK